LLSVLLPPPLARGCSGRGCQRRCGRGRIRRIKATRKVGR
jgi:hypothetical protein